MSSQNPVIVTGAAGFIGMHVCLALIASGRRVIGIDDLNDYYAVQLKHDRLAQIRSVAPASDFEFHQLSVADEAPVIDLVTASQPDSIVHLAAQAGVRYSIENPMAYARSNLMGMTVMLEAARAANTRHMVYASSSSVYGGNTKVPYSEDDRVDSPVSFYAATKRANEAMAASYAHLYDLPLTGLRFFTVYGPWGRPDMAAWLFTDAILRGKPIRVFGHGTPLRDFTYIDDIVSGICKILDVPPVREQADPHRVLNIGNHEPVSVADFIATLEQLLGREAIRESVDMQPGDVQTTYADTQALQSLVGFRPQTSLHDGMRQFVDWFKSYHPQLG